MRGWQTWTPAALSSPSPQFSNPKIRAPLSQGAPGKAQAWLGHVIHSFLKKITVVLIGQTWLLHPVLEPEGAISPLKKAWFVLF